MKLVEKVVQNGGSIKPIIIENGYYSGIGYMNPSLFVDDDGDILVNLRHINYSLYHSENTQKFPSRWGPLAYLHPEQDQTLRTINYLCRLDKDLNLVNYTIVDTSKLDVAPLWEFIGEEDCRVVKWDGNYYLIGVRRDTTTNGQGRMEYSRIELDKENWTATEVERLRIPMPGNAESYCEKNWVPIIDQPYHFVKWTSPTEVVKSVPQEPMTCETVFIKEGLPGIPRDQRGGSQVISWGDKYITITHEVDLFKNYLNQKDGIYRHRLVVFNKEMQMIGISPEFTFLDTRIEFCAGIAQLGDDLLISFGFQDNAAFVLRTPGTLVDEMIQQAETWGK